MKRIVLALLVVLGSTALMYAKSGAREMTGTICDVKCVTRQSNLATCDTSCTETGGEAVFVDDQGGLHTVVNQNMCKSHMNKRVKLMATPTEEEREQAIRIQELSEEHP
jgi:DNA replicative helicase MCM subunit Mcm2 (Cdc46/Mcm family)